MEEWRINSVTRTTTYSRQEVLDFEKKWNEVVRDLKRFDLSNIVITCEKVKNND